MKSGNSDTKVIQNSVCLAFKIKIFWKKQARNSYIFAYSPQRNSIWNQIQTFWMKKAGQKFLYLCKLSSTEFDLESNGNILNEISRPEISNLSKFCSTKFDLESNWNFLNEKDIPEIPNLSKIASTKFDLKSNWFLNEKGRPEIVEKKVDTNFWYR